MENAAISSPSLLSTPSTSCFQATSLPPSSIRQSGSSAPSSAMCTGTRRAHQGFPCDADQFTTAQRQGYNGSQMAMRQHKSADQNSSAVFFQTHWPCVATRAFSVQDIRPAVIGQLLALHSLSLAKLPGIACGPLDIDLRSFHLALAFECRTFFLALCLQSL